MTTPTGRPPAWTPSRHWRGLLLGAVALTLLAPRAAAAQAPVRVMSFNIRYGTANDGEHRWPNRRAAVVATIRDHAPHILGVQEALRFQLDELGAAFPSHVVLGVGREDGRSAGEFAALLVDTARFDVLRWGTFWLSDTPDVPGSMHWGNRITRITTWARLTDRVVGDTLRVYNAHWDHESQHSRERAADQLLARLSSDDVLTDCVLVLGDFNADEENPALRRLVASENGLRDSYRVLHPDATSVGTFHGFRGEVSGAKIDAVLVGAGWRPVSAGIDRRSWGGRWASDHFAVWSVLERH